MGQLALGMDHIALETDLLTKVLRNLAAHKYIIRFGKGQDINRGQIRHEEGVDVDHDNAFADQLLDRLGVGADGCGMDENDIVLIGFGSNQIDLRALLTGVGGGIIDIKVKAGDFTKMLKGFGPLGYPKNGHDNRRIGGLKSLGGRLRFRLKPKLTKSGQPACGHSHRTHKFSSVHRLRLFLCKTDQAVLFHMFLNFLKFFIALKPILYFLRSAFFLIHDTVPPLLKWTGTYASRYRINFFLLFLAVTVTNFLSNHHLLSFCSMSHCNSLQFTDLSTWVIQFSGPFLIWLYLLASVFSDLFCGYPSHKNRWQ